MKRPYWRKSRGDFRDRLANRSELRYPFELSSKAKSLDAVPLLAVQLLSELPSTLARSGFESKACKSA